MNFTYKDSLAHASTKKSKSKYKGGFRNGKNTSEYNHDYYIKNKDKWDKKSSREKKENEVSFDEIPKGAKITSSESVYAEDHLPKWARGKVDTENNMRIRYGYVKNDDGSYTRFAKHARFSYRPNLPELNKKKSGNSDESNRPHGRKRNDSGKTVEVKKRDKVENLDRPHGRKRNDSGKTAEVKKRNKKWYEVIFNRRKKDEKRVQSGPHNPNTPESKAEKEAREAAEAKKRKEEHDKKVKLAKRGENKNYSLMDRITGKDKQDNLKRANENYERTKETIEQSRRAAASARNKKALAGDKSARSTWSDPKTKIDRQRELTKAKIAANKAQQEYNDHYSTKIKKFIYNNFTEEGRLKLYEQRKRREREKRQRKEELKKKKKKIDQEYRK